VMATAILLAAAPAQGQSTEHHDLEVIEPSAGGVPEQQADLAQATRTITEQTNAFRKKHNRAAVKVSPKLAETASAFAAYMAKNDRYGHTADGHRPSDRAQAQGYEFCIVLENIAYQYDSRDFETAVLTKGFVQGWEESPPHRKSMLDPDVTDTGVGVARSEKTGYYYAVQMFGRPKSLAIVFQIANRSGEELRYEIDERKFRLEPRSTRTHTRCRPAGMKLMPASDKGKPQQLNPVNGDHFVITRDSDTYEVKNE